MCQVTGESLLGAFFSVWHVTLPIVNRRNRKINDIQSELAIATFKVVNCNVWQQKGDERVVRWPGWFSLHGRTGALFSSTTQEGSSGGKVDSRGWTVGHAQWTSLGPPCQAHARSDARLFFGFHFSSLLSPSRSPLFPFFLSPSGPSSSSTSDYDFGTSPVESSLEMRHLGGSLSGLRLKAGGIRALHFSCGRLTCSL